LILDPNMQKRT